MQITYEYELCALLTVSNTDQDQVVIVLLT